MSKRVMTAAIGIPLLLITGYLGGGWFFALALLASIVALWEFYGFARQISNDLSLPLLVIGGLAAFLVTYFGSAPSYLVIIFPILLILELFRTKELLKNGSLLFLGAIYAGSFYAFLPLIRSLGFRYLILLLLITWGSDSVAFFWGRRFGRRKLWPAVSPNKTQEGAFGGLLGGMLGGFVAALFGSVTMLQGLFLGFLGSIIAQLGDLTESAMKRESGIKDSGDILPGHGGMLDRFDSLMMLAPFMYLLLKYVLGKSVL